MDFLKTLLVYLSLTFAMGVQEAPLPQGTPAPTAVSAQVQAQMAYTPEPTKTPKPTATATVKAGPTMTPNSRYSTLRLGDRGQNVTKMQQRLVELGYLTSKADGIFGYGTYDAVRAFQKANGLSADGQAGKQTLTQLYENPNVVANPKKPTATPTAKVNTPKPEAGAAAKPVVETAPGLTEGWKRMTNANLLLNGEALSLLQQTDGVTRRGRPRIWVRGEEDIVFSLTDMCEASNQATLTTMGENGCTVEIAGYVLTLSLSAPEGASAQKAYIAAVDGKPVALSSGDAMWQAGEWYASPALLIKTVGAKAQWDAEENALILTVTNKSLAGSKD